MSTDKTDAVFSLVGMWLRRLRIVEIDFSEGAMVITFESDRPGHFGDAFFRTIERIRFEDSQNEWELRYDELSRFAVRGLQTIVTYKITSAFLVPIPEPATQAGGGEPFLRSPTNITVYYRDGKDSGSHNFP